MSAYEGVIWYLAPTRSVCSPYPVHGPLWYRVHEGTVQRRQEGEPHWLQSAAFGRNVRAFLQEQLPQVPAVGQTHDADLEMDEGL